VVFTLFDWDPSGNVMAGDLEDKYGFWNDHEHGGDLDIEYVRVALTAEQAAPGTSRRGPRRRAARTPSHSSATRLSSMQSRLHNSAPH
jgi:hypothetical protein